MSRHEETNKGNLTISRWSGSDTNPRNVTIRVIDENSGIEFVSVSITPEELGLAITGSGHISCEYSVNGLRSIGKKSETKAAIVAYAKGDNRKHDKKALAALEVDGWEARRSDLENHHCWRESGIMVTFFRLVGESVLERAERGKAKR